MATDTNLVDRDELVAVLNLGGHQLYGDDLYDRIGQAATDVLVAYLEPRDGGYTDVPAVREAALAIAVDLWQARVAPGGVMQAADFTPGPYRLSRGILTRVSGLIAPWRDPAGMVG